MQRAVKWAANLHQQGQPGAWPSRVVMVTLTYSDAAGWRPDHITACLKAVREWFRRLGRPFRYVWVAELQKRGAVHYHLLVWMPRGLTLPFFDRRGWWPHGSSNAVWARKPVGYLCKYASKFDGQGGDFPKGARIHGSGGFDSLGKAIRHWWSLPGWLRAQCGVGDRIVRPKGGGFVHAPTGEFVHSPWRFAFTDGVGHVREIFEYVSGVPNTGPYSRLEPVNFVKGEVAL